jgi:hypothetical protein
MLHSLRVSGFWARLHNANSSVLDSLLTGAEVAAIARRLGRPIPVTPDWVPADSGEAGGRFAQPRHAGALYLGNDLETCVAEIIHHHSILCADSDTTPVGMHSTYRHLVFRIAGTMAEATRHGRLLLNPSDYAASWNFGRRVRKAQLDGVNYLSVRAPGGTCLAIFENRAVQFHHVEFGAVLLEWDGSRSRRIG